MKYKKLSLYNRYETEKEQELMNFIINVSTRGVGEVADDAPYDSSYSLDLELEQGSAEVILLGKKFEGYNRNVSVPLCFINHDKIDYKKMRVLIEVLDEDGNVVDDNDALSNTDTEYIVYDELLLDDMEKTD